MKHEDRKTEIGCAIVIVHPVTKKLLVGRRGRDCKRGAGLWSFPTGSVHEDETVEDCVIREAWEETGLVVLVEPPPTGNRPYETSRPLAFTDHVGEYNCVTVWFMAVPDVTSCLRRHLQGDFEAKEPTKCDGWHWLSLQEIAELSGVSDYMCEQYRWLPIDVLKARLPAEVWG